MSDFTNQWEDVINKRNLRLQSTDWTQLPDANITDTKKAEYATYRQALRDIPQRVAAEDRASTNPLELENLWPTPPS